MPPIILVVEDHAPFRRLICTSLARRPEFQVLEAANGLEAVWKAGEFQPHVIVLDIHLPKLDGFEVAKHVGMLAPKARLLFLSQETSPDFVREAFAVGAHGYVQKVSAGTDLLPAIDALLDGRRFVGASLGFAERADAPASRRHEVLFCSYDAAIVDGLSSFIADALDAADAAIAVATPSHQQRLLQELRAQGVDIDGAIARGTYLSFDADVDPDPALLLAAIDRVREAAAKAGNAHPRVALCGERAGRLWAAGRTAEAAQLEHMCSALADDVDILCAYPVPYTEADHALSQVCAEHTAVSSS